jgi:hypothetical protein
MLFCRIGLLQIIFFLKQILEDLVDIPLILSVYWTRNDDIYPCTLICDALVYI